VKAVFGNEDVKAKVYGEKKVTKVNKYFVLEIIKKYP